MSGPTLYARVTPEGKTIVWARCPFCGGEVIVHPHPGEFPRPWYEIPCSACGRAAGDADASASNRSDESR